MKTTRRIALAVIAAAAVVLGACQPAAGASDGDIVLGNPQAPVQIIEYASTTCGHCAEFHRDVFPTIKRDFIDTGRVSYVMREFRTPPAEIASAGFMIARCAAGGNAERYYEIIGMLFERQNAILQASMTGGALEELWGVARQAGMERQAFDTCLRDPEAQRRMAEVERKGVEQFQISGTPTIIIDGTVFRPPNNQRYTVENMTVRLNEALN
jgi:protein-disulfide isomerase